MSSRKFHNQNGRRVFLVSVEATPGVSDERLVEYVSQALLLGPRRDECLSNLSAVSVRKWYAPGEKRGK